MRQRSLSTGCSPQTFEGRQAEVIASKDGNIPWKRAASAKEHEAGRLVEAARSGWTLLGAPLHEALAGMLNIQ